MMQYDREHSLHTQLNEFLVKILGVPGTDYAEKLDLSALLSLKSTLSDINNLITVKLALGLADWIADRFQLDETVRAEMRKIILETKPNTNGFDVWLGYPLTFVGEVKCNVPINGGEKYGTQQRNGIIADVETLISGKRKSPMITKDILKFMAFLDVPEVRAANTHLLKSNKYLAERLVFLDPEIIPSDVNYVHGVYVKLAKGINLPEHNPLIRR
ncbi:hypothetical protein ACO0LM_22210 [Undibacterium sp. Di26W]|uniref:hypothetical protein n=1 Tax=Undibacterium sp. Di26W TaxID=3413035 RepID=UPI003BF0B6BB